VRDRKEPRSVLLVYASRRQPDIRFYGELMAMQAGAWPLLTVVHVLSDPSPWWRGETGRLDAARLAQLCDGVAGKSFYLCGPPTMTGTLVRGLRRMGVSQRRIHTDYFSL
jgi:ferredoxin-NADP reductase